MLYKLSKTGVAFDSIEPLPFKTFADCGQTEKDLENLLSENLLDGLFEGNELMPIFQERARQEEADIYALNRRGDLVIFELKRATAGGDAVHQVLRYCETAAHWNYDKLQRLYSVHRGGEDVDLQAEHQANFELEVPLPHDRFNQEQRLMVIGAAGNEGLVKNIDYWRSKGISIEFVSYRIYEIGGEHYFEFFSPPYDSHSNPAHRKGVIFDTCRTYYPESIWYMCEKSRVAAFGDQMHVVNYLGMGDVVFLYHKWEGIIAAGRVKSAVKSESSDINDETLYRDLEWLIPPPDRNSSHSALSAAEIKKVLGRNFFWARTIKTPYLSVDESDKLLEALRSQNE
jgi:hypothetical protein